MGHLFKKCHTIFFSMEEDAADTYLPNNRSPRFSFTGSSQRISNVQQMNGYKQRKLGGKDVEIFMIQPNAVDLRFFRYRKLDNALKLQFI